MPEAQRDALILRLDEVIARRYGDRAWLRAGPDYGRMVDAASVERLERLTRQSVQMGARIVLGGEFSPPSASSHRPSWRTSRPTCP